MFEDIVSALKTVIASAERRHALLFEDASLPLRLAPFLLRVVPASARALASLRSHAERVPDDRLRAEALASIGGKAFHVAGASILATFLSHERARHYIDIVAPLETIYDYLDNLCDRHPDVPPEAYPVLHRAVADALDPSAPLRDYYALGPRGDDGGYLSMLVRRTQNALATAPYGDRLRAPFAEAASFYAELQTFKHLEPGRRERECVAWYERNRERFGQLDWHEFACASGSNMHVFGALYEAFAERPDAIARTYDAYFPYVAALHILLDSFIDRREDREHGDLNFADPYGGALALRNRFLWMTAQAEANIDRLDDAHVHRFVLRVMTLFYLSHPKIREERLEREARSLLRANAKRKGGPPR